MTADRNFLLEAEDRFLAPFASKASCSRGRRFAEEPHAYRTDFQRDRERIIHSRSFRRLEYKTQVFINSEGDHYRTRLTHTIEVAQIARTLARALRLNEDLAESIALAHDLGHTPFGHAGERALNSMLAGRGGFEHNRQSLRVVDFLETNYADFPGINLTWETREGIIRHSPGIPEKYLKEFNPAEQPSLEAQIIDLADEIAYNNHDLDDGISSGILDPEKVHDLTLWKMAEERFGTGTSSDKKMTARIMVRRIINLLATDLIENTEKNIKALAVETAEDIRRAPERLAVFSPAMEQANRETKLFLTGNLYRHYRVSRMTIKAEKVIKDLFEIYTQHPETIPDSFCQNHEADDPEITATDYIAGMTDRFALEEHSKLTDPSILA